MIDAIAHVLLCWLAADFLSGLFHWLEDRYFTTALPILGKYVAAPNEVHHSQPTEFLRGGYWFRNWTTIVPAGIACLLTLWSPWCLTFLFLTQANEIHAWAHQRCNRWVRALQETGLIQSAKHHGGHHRAPFDCRYCVMTNWLNPVLDELRFWFVLEWLVSWLGIYPKEQAVTA